jgi:hypothetical protein
MSPHVRSEVRQLVGPLLDDVERIRLEDQFRVSRETRLSQGIASDEMLGNTELRELAHGILPPS